MKKVLSAALIFLMLCQCCGVCAEAPDERTDTTVPYTVLWDEDFDNTESGHKYFTRSNNVEVERFDSEHGRVCKVECKNGTWPEFRKNFDLPIKSGVIYLGYDLLRNGDTRSMDTLLSKENGVWGDGLFVGTIYPGKSSKSRVSYYGDCHVNQIYTSLPTGLTTTVNVWSHFDSWYDLDNRIAYHYVDGQLLGQTTITEEMTQVTTYRRVCNGAYGECTEYYDNFKIVHIDNAADEFRIDGAMNMPYYMGKPVILNSFTESLGNSFFDEEQDIIVSMDNLKADSISGVLNLALYDNCGKAVLEQSRNETIAAKETKTAAFSAKFLRYGEYYARIKFTPDSGESTECETTLVRMKKSDEQNQKLGLSAHNYWGYGTDELDRKQKMFVNAGFKYSREDIFWVKYEMQKGVYKFDELQTSLFNTTFNNNMETLCVLVTDTVNPEWCDQLIPKSEESLKNFGDYVYNMVSDLKGKVKYYEVFNEKNFKFPADEVYLKAQKTAYEAAKRADPDCKVLCGATAYVTIPWIEQLLSLGAGQYFDVFSCHPYTVQALPEVGMSGYGTSEESLVKLRNLLDEYGLRDKSIAVTENGYSDADGYSTADEQATYDIRQYIMCDPYVELYSVYNDQCKGDNRTMENGFGMLRYWNSKEYVPYQAKPVLRAFSAYNSLLANAENLGRQQTQSDDIWIYRFRRSNDGMDVLALWNSENEKKTICLDLGCDSLDLYDIDGNKTRLYAYNGKFNINISGNVSYLVGHFSRFVQTGGVITADKHDIEAISGEKFRVRIKIPDMQKVSIKTDCSENISEVANENGVLEFSCGTNSLESEKVIIKVYEEGKCVSIFDCPVKYVEPVSYDYTVLPYNTQRYQAVLKIKNNRSSDVSAEFKIDSPKSMGSDKLVVDTINPGNVRTMKINVDPKEMDNYILNISGTLNIGGKNGVVQTPTEMSARLGCLKYGNKKPTIDGVISPNEWYEFLPMRLNKKEMARQKDWRGPDDLSAVIYTMCDDDYFYLAAEVTDDVFYDKDTPARVWANDSVQFAMTDIFGSGGKATEIGFGKSNGENVIQSYLSQIVDNNYGSAVLEFSEDTLYEIKRYEEEKKTVYELQIPWTQIFNNKPDFRKQKEIYFSVMVNDDDNDGKGRGWLEYCPGIGSEKNPALFMKLPVYRVNQ